MREGKKIWRSVFYKIRRFAFKSIRKINKLSDRIPKNHQKLIFTISKGIGIGFAVFGIIAFAYFQVINNSYKLSPKLLSVIGSPDKNILNKFSYDKQSKAYYLAKSDIGNKSAGMKSTGDGGNSVSGYSSRLPINSSQGITTYDNSSNISFTMTPMFKTMSGRASNGRVIYPLSVNGPKAIYTIKHNGTQEDIAYSKSISDSASYKYKLDLPSGLEARTTADGNIGIYSADSYLYGNISYGSDSDKQKLMMAKQKAAKNNLVFIIPAPTIVAKGKNSAKTSISLKNNEVTISATKLSSIKGSFSIDPSVVVASVSSFQNGGNNEGDITYDSTNNQIYQSGLTGGNVGSWTTSATGTPLGRYFEAVNCVVYNGYVYMIGGGEYATPNYTFYNTVYYSKINADGTLGSWNTTTNTNLPLIAGSATTTYNGFIYLIGGANGAGSGVPIGGTYAPVYYSKVNADGTLGSWNTTTNSTISPFVNGSAVSYNGYIYVTAIGINSNAYYSKVNADGTLGSWTTVSGALSLSVVGSVGLAYNGYIYILGGQVGGSQVSNVYYSKLNSNGSLGTFGSLNSLPQAVWGGSGSVNNGYLYVCQGYNSTTTNISTCYYSSVGTNGKIGSWSQTAAMPTYDHFGVMWIYNNRLYVQSGYKPNIYYSAINSPGYLDSWSQSKFLPNGGVINLAVTVNNGYIYAIGGYDGNFYYSTVYYAAICTGQNTTTAFSPYTNCTTSSAPGSISDWAATTSLPVTSSQASAVSLNGYIYLIGGLQGGTAGKAVYYSSLNIDGTVNSWATTTNLPVNLARMTAVSNNGAVYVIGGTTSGTSIASIYYSTVGGNGALPSWTTSSVSLPVATQQLTASVYGNYLYVLGGYTTANTSNVYYAPINSNSTLGSFTSATTLPSASTEGSSFIANGYIYYLGAYSKNVYYALLNANGSISAWNTTSSTINPNGAGGLGAASAVFYGGYAYYLGGYDKTNYNGYLYYSAVNNGGTGQTSGWITNSNSLPQYYTGSSASVYNGKIYLFRSQVYYASINSDGSVGTWSSTTSLPFNDFGPSSFAYNGFAYVMGGYYNASNAYCQSGLGSNFTCNSVLRAPINSDGTLGSWTQLTSTPLPVAVETFGAVQWNGYVYAIGGTSVNGSGSFVSQSGAYYSKINSDGSLGSWNTTTSLPSADNSFAAVAYNGYIYKIGGAYYPKNVYYSKINSDGSLGSWTTGTSMNESRVGIQAAAYNGYIYTFGGASGYGYISPNNTSYAPINSNGSIGSWNTNIPNNFLVSNYSFEGPSGCSTTGWSSRNGSVLSTSNSNSLAGYGSCSLQVTSTTATGGASYALTLQPNTTYNLSMNIKATGASNITDLAIGYQNNGVDTAGICPTTTTGYASASGASTTGFTLFYCTFTTPASVTGTTNIYVSATTNSSDAFYVDNVVFLAQPGSPSASLPDNLSSYGLASNNGIVYLIGGYSNFSSQGQIYAGTSKVYYTAFQSIPRVGYYSQLQDLTGSSSQDPTPFEMTVNGGACASGSACSTSSTNNLPTSGSGGLNGPGGVSVAYAFARNICSAFNSSVSLTYINTLFGAIQPATNTTSACSSPNNAIGNSRYVWTRYTIDDSQTATFPDALSNKTTISNYNWYYHAANNARLRGGSSFGNNSLQTLDAPP